MSIAAANVAPDLSFRRRLTTGELKRLEDPAALFEHFGHDTDGAPFYVYTVAGWLDGQNVATSQGGCTVGGDAIVINADDRETADAMAAQGLGDTINFLDQEDEHIAEAAASLSRMEAIGALDRMRLATAKPADKSDQFEHDAASIRVLRGDDIVLSAGAVGQSADTGSH